MGERKFEVTTYGVDYVCDSCDTGIMEQIGILLPTDPPKWKYKCNHCGTEANLHEKYSTVRYERGEVLP